MVSPDVGGVARARELAQRIGAPLSIVDKRREKPGEVAEMTVIGNVKDRVCIVVDDIVDTAGTLCKGAETLMEAGAKGSARLYQPRCSVRPRDRTGHQFGDEKPCRHRHD